MIKKYTVNVYEEQEFLNSISKEFEDETYKYSLSETKKTGGNYTEKNNEITKNANAIKYTYDLDINIYRIFFFQ